jgi:hypothetical protein
MAVTLGDMKGRISQLLQGYTRNQEQITWLAQAMTALDTSFLVDIGTSNSVTRGLVQIDDELLIVNNFNTQVGLVNVAAGTNGRGVENTTAVFHDLNAIVTMDPDFPRQRITEAINDTIQATYPDLYVMSAFEFPKTAARYEYQMPAEAEGVYKVTADTIGPSKVKFQAQRWRFNSQAQNDPASGLTTNKTLEVMDQIVPGRTIRAMYTKKPGTLTSNSDPFEATTGYPERYIDMIQFGAVARLLSGVEPARLQQKSVESTERAPLVPTGAATSASRYFWQLYQQRFDQEVERLHQLFPSYQTFLA